MRSPAEAVTTSPVSAKPLDFKQTTTKRDAMGLIATPDAMTAGLFGEYPGEALLIALREGS
jgi:hypothetical protein